MVYFDEVLEVRFSLFLQIRFFKKHKKHSEFGINNSLFRSSKFDREVQAKINIRRINTIKLNYQREEKKDLADPFFQAALYVG